MVTVPFGCGRSTGNVGTLNEHEATECHPVDEVRQTIGSAVAERTGSGVAGQSGVLPLGSSECTCVAKRRGRLARNVRNMNTRYLAIIAEIRSLVCSQ